MSGVLLPLVYLPNVYWFKNFLLRESALIEREENFMKGTWRNRCEIAGANSRQLLSIPLKGGRDHHRLYKEVKIDYTVHWQKNHWQSIKSAYGSSPFYDHYEHKFYPLYQTQIDLLFDFNTELLKLVLQILKTEKRIEFTTIFDREVVGITDLRNTKAKQEADFKNPHYLQPFETKNGFLPNLSIIDVIFNLGPAAKTYLTNI